MLDKKTIERQRAATILDAMKDAVAITDLEGKIIHFNNALAECFGWGKEITGKPLATWFSKRDAPSVMVRVKECATNGSPSNLECTALTKKGKRVPVLLDITLWRGQRDKPIGLLTIARDMSELRSAAVDNAISRLEKDKAGELMRAYFDLEKRERELEKAYEQLKKLDTLKTDFMNIGAHELKTPLIPIISHLEIMMADKRLPLKHKRRLETIYQATVREKKLVDDIVDMSKLEGGTMKFEMDNVQLVDVIKEVVRELQPCVEEKKLTLRVRLPPKLPLVRGDERRLIQVVSNLLENATKFTEKGRITIEARQEWSNVSVKVEDAGIGIANKHMPKLFKKFFQVDSSVKRAAGGTGLGLAICEEIIEAHKGKMWVESWPGVGSAFSFSIPVFTQRKKKKK